MASWWQNIPAAWDVLKHGRGGVITSDENILLTKPSYPQLMGYYNNDVFKNAAVWANAVPPGLARNILGLYNPCRRVVRFYVGAVYPGSLSEDGRALPDGWSLAVPLAGDMSPELKTAIAQLWQWSNFATQKNLIVRYGAILGDVLVEVRDDVEGGKVYFEPFVPWKVSNLLLDIRGNLQTYTLEYSAQDDKTTYTFKKIVTREFIRTFKNNEPFGYDGNPAAYPNPYPFIPAVWIRHEDVGTERGAPALAGSYDKINYLMSLATMVHYQVRKTVYGKMVIATDGNWSAESLAAQQADKRPAASRPARRDPETIDFIKMPADAKSFPLINNLSLADALNTMRDLLEEIEADQPVLKMYDQLRSMSQLTGPAAERLVGDAANLLYEAQGQYDRGLASLFQMGVAMAGMRLKRNGDRAPGVINGWANPSAQQLKFSGFDLTSYGRGELDVIIPPRPLLPPTAAEKTGAKLLRYQALKSAIEAGLPPAMAMRDLDWSEEDILAYQQEDEAVFNQRVARIETEVGRALVQGREDVTTDVRQ